MVRLLGWWPTHASEVYSASGARYGRGGVVQLGRSSESAASAASGSIAQDEMSVYRRVVRRLASLRLLIL